MSNGSGPGHASGSRATPTAKPSWLKVRFPSGERYFETRRRVKRLSLHTVCEEARCPNMGECWQRGTATFMILGNICTRACGFCSVATGLPGPIDPEEPDRVAAAIAEMGLAYAVITSVDRDDLEDGGAAHFAATLKAIRRQSPSCKVELLVPDFKKSGRASLATILEANPYIFAHNVETVPSLYRRVRPGAGFEQSCKLLERAAAGGGRTKSGFMLGLGETPTEVLALLRRLRDISVSIVTIGQYLRPTPHHLPVVRFVPPEEFAEYKRRGESLGIPHVESGPLVRSSYRAETFAGPVAGR